MLAQARIMGVGLQVRISIPMHFSVEGKEKCFHLRVMQNPVGIEQNLRYSQKLHSHRASLPVASDL